MARDPEIAAAIDHVNWDPRWHEELTRLQHRSIAMMIYGSQARGTAGPDSDVDVLQLVRSRPRARSLGPVNVTAYTPSHLRRMALSGSLFVLHLRCEGQLLYDPAGTLTHALETYRHPTDYSRHKHEIVAAASALTVSDIDFSNFGQGVGRLGIYLVRTAAYICCIERGVLTFDLDRVLEVLRLPSLRRVVGLRKASHIFVRDDLRQIQRCLHELLPGSPPIVAPSLEALAVILSSRSPQAASLVANVLRQGASIDYATVGAPL